MLKLYRRLDGRRASGGRDRALPDRGRGLHGNTPPCSALEAVDPDGIDHGARHRCSGSCATRATRWAWTLERPEARIRDAGSGGPRGGRPDRRDLRGLHALYAHPGPADGRVAPRASRRRPTIPAFAAEPLDPRGRRGGARDARALADRAFAGLIAAWPRTSDRPQRHRRTARARGEECLRPAGRAHARAGHAVKTRIHGDYHLGQVLIVQRRRADRRLRGRAVAAAARAPAKSSPAARRRRHAALLRVCGRDLRPRHPRQAAGWGGQRVGGGRQGRADPGRARLPGRLRGNRPGEPHGSATTRPGPPCCDCICSPRPSTRSATRPTTGPTGSRSRSAAS